MIRSMVRKSSFGMSLYNDVSAMYTLRQPPMDVLWANEVLRLRRSSDNATKGVLFDVNGKISLSSLLLGGGTLGDWVGGNDAFVSDWYSITNNNILDFDKTAKQYTNSLQPQFISNGVIITKNSEPTIDFLSDTRYLEANVNTDLNSGNDFTILTVSNNSVLNDVGGVVSTNKTGIPDNYKFDLYNDNRIQKRLTQIRASGVNYFSDYLLQQNTTNQKTLSSIVTSSKLTSYYNSTLQNSILWSGTYSNTEFIIGALTPLSSPLNGTIQEIIIFPSDKTADLTELNTDINDYYNIY